ncbi:MbnP family protein [Hymenobacter nivis]|uniref:Copper-binding protein MbnP-like domain-containing protein n=1 Tax=Hymenobacter nivis TaxID=1850093 RepID=A0A2Z3GFK5_9BACT|nr:MbnP family protein [Hymenobacter nivis]AWM31598.1 hypothetical protein DDQ68_01610 [Hymenobacter nivis]
MNRFCLWALLLPLAISGCKKDEAAGADTGSVSLEMTTVVGTAPLAFDGTSYTKSDGQTFRVTKFKYLLSNVQLLRADGTAYTAPDSYYLVDAAQTATQHLVVPNVPLAEYTGLRFVVGVDAARNTAGAQTGALDPNNDLYWDWTAGYVFLKMEGTSPQAPHPAAAAEGGLRFHIGDNGIQRTITFAGIPLAVTATQSPAVHLRVNVLALFDNAGAPSKNIDFSKTSEVMGGAGAPAVADNYAAGLFTMERVAAN